MSHILETVKDIIFGSGQTNQKIYELVVSLVGNDECNAEHI